MSLHLYDNYERKRREFVPLNDAEVGLYTCGPTVYDYQHIGNLRTYLFEDLLKRVLDANGYKDRHVMNITDVGHLTSDADTGEDKMEKGSRRTGRSAWDIAAEYTQVFRDDLKALNIAEHSMCQPGKPRPHGLSHSIWRCSPAVENFHSAKSVGLRFSPTSMRLPASCPWMSRRARCP